MSRKLYKNYATIKYLKIVYIRKKIKMENICEKNNNEILSDTYPSANQWNCYPFNDFNFQKNVNTIRKTLVVIEHLFYLWL